MADAPLETIVYEIAADTRKILDALRSVEGHGTQTARRMEGAFAPVTAVFSRLAAAAAAYVSVGFARSLFAEADALGRVATEIGVGVEVLQRLEFAARQNGAGLDDLRTGLRIFSRELAQAQRGQEASLLLFRGMDVAVRNLDGTNRGIVDVLGDVADHFRQVGVSVESTEKVLRLFGRGSTTLLGTLRQGREGLAELGAEAERVGAVISSRTVKDIKEMEDETKALSLSIRRNLTEALTAVLPAIEFVTGALRNLVLGVRSWFKGLETAPDPVRALSLEELEARLASLKEQLRKTLEFYRTAPLEAHAGIADVASELAHDIVRAEAEFARRRAVPFPPPQQVGPMPPARRPRGDELDEEYEKLVRLTRARADSVRARDVEARLVDETRKRQEAMLRDLTPREEAALRRQVELVVDQAKAYERVDSSLRRFGEDAADTFALLQDAGVSSLRRVEDAMVAFTFRTKSAFESLRDLALGILEDVYRAYIRSSVTGPLAGLLDQAVRGIATGGFFGLFGRGVPAGGTAGQGQQPAPRIAQHGADVVAGVAYRVNEGSPEVFIPRVPGRVEPTGGGGTIVVNQYLDFRNADRDAALLLAAQAERIKAETVAAVAAEARRGGEFSRAVGRR